VVGVGAGAAEPVDLVEEDDARRDLARVRERGGEQLDALAPPLALERRRVQANHRDAALGRDRAREHRLARARRAVQKHARGRERGGGDGGNK